MPSWVPPFPAPRALTGMRKDIPYLLGFGSTQAHIDFPKDMSGRGEFLKDMYGWGGCIDLSMGPSSLAPQLFPAVSPGEPSYRSLLLINKGSMLLTFNLAPQSSPDISLRPSSGLVAPGAHQIFLICTYPKGNSWRQHVFYLQFNLCPQYLQVGGRDGDWVLGRGPPKATFLEWSLKLPLSSPGTVSLPESGTAGKGPLGHIWGQLSSGPCLSTLGGLGQEKGCRGLEGRNRGHPRLISACGRGVFGAMSSL